MTAIIVGLFNFLHRFFNGILPTLSDTGFVSQITGAVSYMGSLVAGANYLVPVSDIFAIIGIVVGIRVLMFSVFAFNWLIRFFVI